jgi:glycosyltransferase involved in cell wall biosynthesis
VIGVDPDGLALADSMAHGAPLGYYSLELLLSYELSTPDDERLKAQERELSQRAAFVVIQDEDRGRLLAQDNDLPWERVVLVPNAPHGPARRRPTRVWHERFSLPPQARVVLHAGSLGDWTGIEAIVDSVADWPAEWVLVIHTRYDAESSDYVDDLRRRADPRRVWFSLRPVPRQEYDALIDAADVGVALYVATGASSFTGLNIQTIGLSSGKLAYYLRAGLPVIVNRAASVADVVESSACGVSVEDASGIGAALTQLDADYDRFSANARAYFDEQLDFRRAFVRVVERVDALARVS